MADKMASKVIAEYIQAVTKAVTLCTKNAAKMQDKEIMTYSFLRYLNKEYKIVNRNKSVKNQEILSNGVACQSLKAKLFVLTNKQG